MEFRHWELVPINCQLRHEFTNRVRDEVEIRIALSLDQSVNFLSNEISLSVYQSA